MLKRLQEELFKILLDIDYVCKKHDIKYMLCGGTLIGAIRHKGFIPWDDDIDLMMIRSEAEKLVVAMREEFPEKYMVGVPLCDEQYVVKSIKIFKRGTKYVEIPFAGLSKFDMLFVDVLVIENVPANKLARKIHSKYYNFIYKAASVCVDYKYPSPVIEEKAKDNPELAKYWKTRKSGIPSGGCVVENFPEKMYLELTTAEFCGRQFPVPKDYDENLRVVFGDYMQIPEPSKRDCHVAYKIEF